LALVGCAPDEVAPGARAASETRSVFTSLGADSCEEQIDRTDPNETPVLVCAGVGGYSIIVRKAGSGRRSVDLRGPGDEAYPLDFQEFVTRSMNALGEQAEWRVTVSSGQETPIALLVRVHAHEDSDNPEAVTRTLVAISKIDADEACVVDVVPETEMRAGELAQLADGARERPCAPTLPEPQ
jgi:hypothetical protein